MASHLNETLHLPPGGIRAGADRGRDLGNDRSDSGRSGKNPGWPELPVIESDQLFGEANEVGIVHEGALYRLKITRQGKLVLNK